MTEKFYGRTARLFLFRAEDPADGSRSRRDHAPAGRRARSIARRDTTGFGLVRARLSTTDASGSSGGKKLIDDFRAADTRRRRAEFG